MIVVDRALEERAASGRPVQVGMVGAGAMGRGIARQMFRAFPGLRLAAVANRTLDNAARAYAESGVTDPRTVSSAEQLERAIAANEFAITDDPMVLCAAPSIEALVEVTGTVDHAAAVVEAAMAGGKHVILMNAELDGTIGPILKAHADAAGVILTGCDGDQPGVEANLYRFVKGIGLRPLVCGNIKGLQDPYRTPTTQQGYAETWGQGVRDGNELRRWNEGLLRAGDRGQRDRHARAPRGMLGQWQHSGHVDELTSATTSTSSSAWAASSITSSVLKPGPGVYVHCHPRRPASSATT